MWNSEKNKWFINFLVLINIENQVISQPIKPFPNLSKSKKTNTTKKLVSKMIQLFISRLKPFSDLLNVCKETEDPLESKKKE